MLIIPVLDLLRGVVVRGIGGRRDAYRPIVSRLTPSTDPLAVARAFRTHFGLTELYLADLDAIMGQAPALALYQMLQADGFRLWVDAGIRNLEDARRVANAGVATLVVGLETVDGPDTLEQLCAAYGSPRLVFSLDLKQGQALGKTESWLGYEPAAIVRQAVATGVRRLLVLDLARVGEGSGTGTGELCSRFARSHPDLHITAGGGIRDMDDVRSLERSGVSAVLIASALHDGRIEMTG